MRAWLLFTFVCFVSIRYAQGVVPTVSKLTTAPIGVIKTVPTAGVNLKSVYSQHDEYYVSIKERNNYSNNETHFSLVVVVII